MSDLNRGLAEVHRGKGGKGRCWCRSGRRQVPRLDRYMRIARRELRFVDGGPAVGGCWRSDVRLPRHQHEALKARAAAAGIPKFHIPPATPHRGDTLAAGGRFRARVDGCRRVGDKSRCSTGTPAPVHRSALPPRRGRYRNLGDM